MPSLPEAVTAVEDWYRRRNLPPMIVLFQGSGPDPRETFLTERGWVPRPGPAFVMTADIADIPASDAEVRLASLLSQYFRCGFHDSHRYHYMIAP